MFVMLFMGLFWTVYGIIGLFGYQRIPKRFKGHSWTMQYIRYQGLSWIMMGAPMLALYCVLKFLVPEENISAPWVTISVIILCLPAIIFTFIWEVKFEKRLNNTSKQSLETEN